jgi:recombination protein RecR
MRNPKQLCVVASPKDIFALEKSGEYKGYYHVLGGLLSPIDGIHPEGLRIEELMHRCETERYQEIIFAINASIEGEATMLYLTDLLTRYNCSISKLAYGLPVGSDIDYADEITLQRALSGRRKIGE